MSEAAEASSGIELRSLSGLLGDMREYPNSRRSDQAILEILRRFTPLLRKYWRWQHVGDYEDFLQEVMVRLFSALPHLRDPEAFPGLFRSIVLAASVDLLRRKSVQLVDIDDVGEDQFGIEFDESTATPVIVRSYLERLPPREREVIDLTFFSDLDPPEIAQRLGLSTGAVRMTKSRAIARLRAYLNVEDTRRGHDAL